MRSGQISFKHKNVVIIGGGNQAAKKADDFLKEEACVKVISKDFLESINEDVRVYKEYDITDIEDAFLVYACTNDKELNHCIVKDANAKNILSASVHKDEEATFHPLYMSDLDNMHIAFSTKGASPAYLKKVEESFKELYENNFKDLLNDLKCIREYVLASSLEANQRREMLKSIAEMSKEDICFYRKAIENKEALVLVFHGNDSLEADMLIKTLISSLKIPCTYALLKKDTTRSLVKIKEYLDLLKIPTKYQPMFLEDGYCVSKMRRIIKETGEEMLLDQKMIESLNSIFEEEKQVILVVHDTKTKQVKTKLQKYLSKHILVMELEEDLPVLNKEEEICLSGLFVLPGKHLKEDVLSECGIYGKLLVAGYCVKKENRSLIEMNVLQEKLAIKYK